MFTYLLWGLIILVLFILIKRIFDGVVLLVVYVLIIFFAVFLLDTITPFPLRSVISLEWYDEALEEPGKSVQEVANTAKDMGGKARDGITGFGNRLDVYYGTETDKEWKLLGEENKEESVKKEVTKEEKVKEETTKDILGKSETAYGEAFLPYKKVNKALKEEWNHLTDGDKEIMRAMTSVYRTRLKGKDIEVWNTGEHYQEGFQVKYTGE